MTVRTGPAAARVRGGARLFDLAWVTWRQHRLALVVTGLAVGGLAGWLFWLRWQVAALGQACDPGCPPGAADRFFALVASSEQLVYFGMTAITVVIATFWAAPLVAREFEQRTHLLAWSQDVSATRWVLGKSTFLGLAAVLFAAVLHFAATGLVREIDSVRTVVRPAEPVFEPFEPWSAAGFELWLPLVLAYTVCVFAIGLTMSVLTRRTVAAMVLTLLGFVTVRVVLVGFRPYYLEPSRVVSPFRPASDGSPPLAVPDGADIVDVGLLDSSGRAVDLPTQCFDEAAGAYSMDCARRGGVVSEYFDYQSAAAAATVRLIELGIYIALTGLLLVIVWRRVRRMAVL